GQRFDSVNRRDTLMKLYTYDAYNTDGGKGTYVAIPLFANTRGGGMFINRYTCVIAVELPDRPGKLVYPTLLSADAHHIVGLEPENE
ncbi:MAG: hypothetical protein E7643_08220, partial [Ruminococcaceae bacterium]|nr:hypothetical protein [Oscillospiraceae bacterium]